MPRHSRKSGRPPVRWFRCNTVSTFSVLSTFLSVIIVRSARRLRVAFPSRTCARRLRISSAETFPRWILSNTEMQSRGLNNATYKAVAVEFFLQKLEQRLHLRWFHFPTCEIPHLLAIGA